MSLFFFAKSLLGNLPRKERLPFEAIAKRLHTPEGRPFFLGNDSLPDEDLDGFCKYLLDPQRASANTWQTYAYQVDIFLRYLEAQRLDWRDVKREDLDLYYTVRTSGQFQNAPPIKGRSWNIAKAAIVHLYEYALDAKLIQQLPFGYRKSRARFGGKAAKVPDLSARTNPEPINFIAVPNYKHSWRPMLARGANGQRNLALADLLITTGLRIEEALSLQLHQIPDPDDIAYRGLRSVTLKTVGKGRKPRLVRVPKRIVRQIRFYIDEDRTAHQSASSTTSVFLSSRGTPLSARAVQGLFARISSAACMKLTPHGCRHTFAIYQLDSMIKKLAANLKELKAQGASAYRQLLNDPLRSLQKMLGHSSVTTTYIYLDFLEESEAMVDETLDAWTNWEEES